MKIKKLKENARIPTYGSAAAAGVDLYSTENYIIHPGECQLVDTGLAIAIPHGYFGGIFPRSGLSVKNGLRLANCVGVVDEDYRGPIKVALYNDSSIDQVVNVGERIAQLVFTPYIQVEFEEVDELDETERGSGGFGSTGTK